MFERGRRVLTWGIIPAFIAAMILGFNVIAFAQTIQKDSADAAEQNSFNAADANLDFLIDLLMGDVYVDDLMTKLAEVKVAMAEGNSKAVKSLADYFKKEADKAYKEAYKIAGDYEGCKTYCYYAPKEALEKAKAALHEAIISIGCQIILEYALGAAAAATVFGNVLDVAGIIALAPCVICYTQNLQGYGYYFGRFVIAHTLYETTMGVFDDLTRPKYTEDLEGEWEEYVDPPPPYDDKDKYYYIRTLRLSSSGQVLEYPERVTGTEILYGWSDGQFIANNNQVKGAIWIDHAHFRDNVLSDRHQHYNYYNGAFTSDKSIQMLMTVEDSPLVFKMMWKKK